MTVKYSARKAVDSQKLRKAFAYNKSKNQQRSTPILAASKDVKFLFDVKL